MCMCLRYPKYSMSKADFPNSLSSITAAFVFPISVENTTILCHLKQKPSVYTFDAKSNQ